MDGKPIRLRITGDVGNPRSIEITDVDTGAKVTNVLEVKITLSRTIPSYVTLTLLGADIDLTGQVRPVVANGELVTSEAVLE